MAIPICLHPTDKTNKDVVKLDKSQPFKMCTQRGKNVIFS